MALQRESARLSAFESPAKEVNETFMGFRDLNHFLVEFRERFRRATNSFRWMVAVVIFVSVCVLLLFADDISYRVCVLIGFFMVWRISSSNAKRHKVCEEAIQILQRYAYG